MTAKPPVLLIHGAWHASWCWSQLSPLLEAAGHEVFTPDLPGHTGDGRPARSITFRHYLESLRELIESADSSPFIVVGHSMAGMLAAALAAEYPGKIQTLIFLNAYIPTDGDSVFSLMQNLQSGSDIEKAMVFSADKRTVALDKNALIPLFYGHTPPALQQKALQSIVLQPAMALNHSVSLNQEKPDLFRKIAVIAANDQVISSDLTRKMLQRQPCDELICIEGDHSLFYSAPEVLASIISAQ